MPAKLGLDDVRDRLQSLTDDQKVYLKHRLEVEKELRRTVWVCNHKICSGVPHAGAPGYHARANQRTPYKQGDGILEWLLMAGRGFGKTRTGAETVRDRVDKGLAGRVALVGRTAADVRDVMLEGESGLLNVYPRWKRPTYQPSKRRVIFHNGALAFAYSTDDPDALRGPQHDFVWGDEVSTWKKLNECLYNIRLGLRLGQDPRAIYTGTPRPTKAMRELVANPKTKVTKGTTYDNLKNLADVFRETVVSQYEGTRVGRQELDGDLLEDIEGALWQWAMFEWDGFRPEYTDELRDSLTHVVVSIDPAVTTNQNSDMTGISVVGKKDHKGYVLVSEGNKTSPNESLKRAIDLYYRYHADYIVAEANNGGDYIESLLRTHDSKVPFKIVHASRGKKTRAEPIVALYEQQRIHHVGTPAKHSLLEDQQTTFTGEDNDEYDSPDVMDAVVWGLSFLMLKPKRREVGAAQTIHT